MFFSKNHAGETAGAKTITSVLGPGLHLSGDISFKGKMRIDGNTEGNILGEYLILGETGTITGEIKVDTFVCSGRVHGSVNVGKLCMISSGCIEGRVETMDLAVESGAILNGEVKFRTQELRLIPGSGSQEGALDETATEKIAVPHQGNRKAGGRK